MQCGEYQMSCLGSGYGCGDSLKISHLSYEDDIRILTECCTECIRIAECIHTNLSLIYYRLVVMVNVLYRILKCDDVIRKILIRLVYNRSKCGRLTGTCRSCYENQSSLSLVELNNLPWNTKLVRSWNLSLNSSVRCCHVSLVHEYIDTETSGLR